MTMAALEGLHQRPSPQRGGFCSSLCRVVGWNGEAIFRWT